MGGLRSPSLMQYTVSKPIREKRPMNDRQVRILVVDDHFVVRQGVKGILKEQFEQAEFGEAANGHDALELVWRQEWDVVLIDISMPGRGGLDVLKEIKQAKPK